MGPEISPAKDKEARRPVINVTDGAVIPHKGRKGGLSSWRISFFGAIVGLVLLPVLSPESYISILKFVPDGLVVTFEVTVFGILLSLVIGLFVGLGQISRNPIISRIASVYVEIIRGIPLIVQIFYIYFALGKLLHVEGVIAGILAMTVCYSAYLGEIFRAGIQSLPKGQLEASLALGLTRGQALRRVIIPQTISNVLPAIGNEFIALLKDSSLVSVVGITDLMQRGRQYASAHFAYFEAFTVVALVYLILTLFLSRLVGLLEERMNKHGR